MKKRKLAVFSLIIGIILVVLGISIIVYTEINNKKNEQKEIEKKVTENYELFKNNVESFNEVRSTYYENVADNLFTETVESDYEKWIPIIDKYSEKVDNVDKSSEYLKEECINKYHSNKDIINKCDSFIIAYETVINYYTKDIESFNEVINLYYDENEIKEEESEIKNYSSKYNYTDINSDGNLIGKE